MEPKVFFYEILLENCNVHLNLMIRFRRESVSRFQVTEVSASCKKGSNFMCSFSASVDNIPNSIFVKLARSAICPPILGHFVINFGWFRWVMKGLAQLA